MDYSILIGGEAGQGMDTLTHILEKTLKRCGYYVFSYKDYMSMVRGGHNFMQIRFSRSPVYTYSSKVDIILALSQETIDIHRWKLKDKGVIIADERFNKGKNTLSLPLGEIARDLGNKRVIGTLGLGGILKYFGLPMDKAKEVIKDEFSERLIDINIRALEAGYNRVENRYDLNTYEDKNIIINGNQGVALGAIAAGCRFYCGYPMTPSTSILSYMAKKSEEIGIVVDQVEDEVAALNMALGASYAGVRAMTGSSGGGFALMVEALSLAGVTEIPVVVIDVQRPGPATGLSTRTEQGDLRFLLHAGHGEFPRMVIALRNPEDAFYQTARAFNLAEKYQIPVLILSDEYLADYTTTVKPLDFNKIQIERHISGTEAVTDEEYKRYKITPSGISPRIIPGKIPGQVVLVDSHEHDEWGHISEDVDNRINMVEKRMRKLDRLKEEVEEPWVIGKERPENLILCWGSTYGAVREVVYRLDEEGVSIGALVFGDIWPFPTKRLVDMGRRAKRIIDVEQNFTGQLDTLVRQESSIRCTHKILKYDGRPLGGDELYSRLKEEVL